MKTAVALLWADLDPVSLAHVMAQQGEPVTHPVFRLRAAPSQRNWTFARRAADRLQVPFHLIDMRSVGAALTGSALTDDIDVPMVITPKIRCASPWCRTAMRSC